MSSNGRDEYEADSRRPLLEDTRVDSPLGSPPTPLTSAKGIRGKIFLTHGKSAEILTSQNAECARGKFEFPTSRQLCSIQMVMCSAYCAYSLTAWLDVSIRHRILFPKCSDYWGSHLVGQWMVGGCVASILVFWLFPIGCCMILLLYFYRDLLWTRIYYTMFAHQVHLDFMNIPFVNAVSVRVMLVWCFLCLFMYPLAGKLTFYGVMQTLPFWIPVVSFGAMLHSQWDIEKRLVTVAKLVENDVEWAANHVKNSFFLRDYIAERAFHKVRKEFNKQRPPPQLTSGEYIQAICQAAEEDHRHHLRDEVAHDADLKRRSHVSIFYAVSPWYWMRQFLYCNYLVDNRAKNFHFWFTVYWVFTCLLMTFLVVLAMTTVMTHLDMQGILTVPGWMTVKNWSIIPNIHDCSITQQASSFVDMAAGALRGTVGGFLQPFQSQTALEAVNAALLEQNAALQRQSEAQSAQVAALLAEMATLKEAPSSF